MEVVKDVSADERRYQKSDNTDELSARGHRVPLLPTSRMALIDRTTAIHMNASRGVQEINPVERARAAHKSLAQLRSRRNALADLVPVYVREECVDVLGCSSTEIHVIRMFIHVHHQDGPRMRRVVSVICKPVVF
jgi:hypothetical protein